MRNTESSPLRRVVVTGVGAVTPLGLSAPETWQNIKLGNSGISSVDIPHSQIKVAGLVHNFNAAEALYGILSKKELMRVGRVAQMSTAAAYEALQDAALLDEDNKLHSDFDPTRIGTRIGTGMGGGSEIPGIDTKIEQDKRISALSILRILPERVASVPSMTFNLQGPLETPAAACATGNSAIIGGVQQIQLGRADRMVVGGVEAYVDRTGLGIFQAIHALSRQTDPSIASRPFDKGRDGFVMAEGAGVLVLEEYEKALERGATMYGEVIGYGSAADAGGDTDPTGDGAYRSMRDALPERSKLLRSGVVYVNAHATSTPIGDSAEYSSISRLVEDEEGSSMYVSSSKGSLGHTLGAAGAIESIISLNALREGVVPPNVNLVDPLCEDEGIILPQEMVETPVVIALNNSFGFGGINSSVAFAHAEDNVAFADPSRFYK